MAAALSTTQLSSKGQVVIPEEIRTRLRLKVGSRFVVVGDQDVIILKTITPPPLADFEALVKRARRQARKAGLKPADVRSAIRRARGRS